MSGLQILKELAGPADGCLPWTEGLKGASWTVGRMHIWMQVLKELAGLADGCFPGLQVPKELAGLRDGCISGCIWKGRAS